MMNRVLPSIIFALCSIHVSVAQRCVMYSDSSVPYWAARDLCRLGNGDLVCVGNARSVANEQYLLLCRMDAGLSMLWSVKLPGVGAGMGNFASVAEAADGSLIVSCSIYYDSDHRALLLRFSGSGELLWSQVIAESMYSAYIHDLIRVGDGAFVAVGVDDGKPVMFKFDQDGNVLWSKRIDNSYYGGIFFRVVELANNDLVVAGRYVTGDITEESEIEVMRITAEGGIVWGVRSSMDRAQSATGITIGPDSALLVTGNLEKADGGFDGYVGAFDLDGALLWDRSFTADSVTISPNDVLYTEAGTIEIIGMVQYTSVQSDCMHMRLDGDGHLIVAQRYGQSTLQSGFEQLQAVIADGPNDCIIAGYNAYGDPVSGSSVLLVSTGTTPTNGCESCGTPLQIDEDEPSVEYLSMASSVLPGQDLPELPLTPSPMTSVYSPCTVLSVSDVGNGVGAISAYASDLDGVITIELNGWHGPVRVQVWDGLGRRLFEQRGMNNGRSVLALSVISSGIHIVRASSGSQSAIAKVLSAP